MLEPRKIEVRAVCKCGTEGDLSDMCITHKIFSFYNDMTYICLNCGAEMKVQVVDLQGSTIINVIKEYE